MTTYFPKEARRHHPRQDDHLGPVLSPGTRLPEPSEQTEHPHNEYEKRHPGPEKVDPEYDPDRSDQNDRDIDNFGRRRPSPYPEPPGRSFAPRSSGTPVRDIPELATGSGDAVEYPFKRVANVVSGIVAPVQLHPPGDGRKGIASGRITISSNVARLKAKHVSFRISNGNNHKKRRCKRS